MQTAYLYAWYFYIYAFWGWCCEVCFAAVKERRFVNRGFLNGPVCPIYGFGVVLVVGLLTPVRGNLLALFFCSVLLTSALEWITGFVLEKAFHQKWWDYSNMPLNLNGYICPAFSLLWGLACVLIIDVVHPVVAGFAAAVPPVLGAVLLGLFTLLLAADLAATAAAVVQLNRRLGQLDELAAKIKAASDGLGGGLAEGMVSLTERGEALREQLEERRSARASEQERLRAARADALRRRRAALEELRRANEDLLNTWRFGQRRLLRAFPRMRSTRHPAALEALRERLGRGRRH